MDERGIADKEALDECLIKLPRPTPSTRAPSLTAIGDLISDPFSLVISPDQHLFRPEVLRADAMKALAVHSANSSIRRALLRKTRNQQDLQPGQAVAFWRWSGRSRQHKKGAWALARFISHDPDGKSIWV